MSLAARGPGCLAPVCLGPICSARRPAPLQTLTNEFGCSGSWLPGSCLTGSHLPARTSGATSDSGPRSLAARSLSSLAPGCLGLICLPERPAPLQTPAPGVWLLGLTSCLGPMAAWVPSACPNARRHFRLRPLEFGCSGSLTAWVPSAWVPSAWGTSRRHFRSGPRSLAARAHDCLGSICLGNVRRHFRSGPRSLAARGPGCLAPVCLGPICSARRPAPLQTLANEFGCSGSWLPGSCLTGSHLPARTPGATSDSGPMKFGCSGS